MPEYTYRREDGTTFNLRQKFSDDPLKVDPNTGQKVVRVVQPAGIIFKGSGFYINDHKGNSSTMPSKSSTDSTESKTPESKAETKTETKSNSSSDAAD